MKRLILMICFLTMLFVFQTFETRGQSGPVTVQGSLKDGDVPANGAYDIRCTFFSVAEGGTSSTFVNFASVPVTNGIFSVTINSADSFLFPPLSNRWIEFSVKKSGVPEAMTTLAPRQIVSFVPYALSSINALFLDGISPSELVRTNDARLTDARNPLAGSPSYLQNRDTPQSNTNFNISGNGTIGGTLTAGIVSANSISSTGIISGNLVNSTLGYQIGGVTAFRMGNCNTFAGNQAGLFTNGTCNSFYGQNSGRQSSTGNNNSFFGAGAGFLNDAGNDNSFFGSQSGNNSQGSRNSFFGVNAGLGNLAGNSNTLFGYSAATVGTLTNATAVGANSQVNQSNALVLGSINGVNGATADTNVGIGTTTPNTNSKLHVNGTVRVTNGAVYITNPNTVIITSPNGACWGITVNNSGALATFPVTPCPQ
jgi:hypothetical protein